MPKVGSQVVWKLSHQWGPNVQPCKRMGTKSITQMQLYTFKPDKNNTRNVYNPYVPPQNRKNTSYYHILFKNLKKLFTNLGLYALLQKLRQNQPASQQMLLSLFQEEDLQ